MEKQSSFFKQLEFDDKELQRNLHILKYSNYIYLQSPKFN